MARADSAPDPAAVTLTRGAYVFAVAGCAACHTDRKNKGPMLAGGPALETPFGTFYGPNITPDPTYGIGRWTDAEFVRALREGLRADGAHLFPVFPYPSFTLMTDADMLDLKAYIFSLPPVAQPSREQDVWFPFSWRWLQTFWRWLNFTPGPYVPDPAKSAVWNRGAYIVQGVAHCGECHTPRDFMGGLENGLAFSGNADGPDRLKVPDITPDKATGIGSWQSQPARDVPGQRPAAQRRCGRLGHGRGHRQRHQQDDRCRTARPWRSIWKACPRSPILRQGDPGRIRLIVPHPLRY